MRKRQGEKAREEAAEVFRQFAWNLAGTLARKKPARSAPGKRQGGRA